MTQQLKGAAGCPCPGTRARAGAAPGDGFRKARASRPGANFVPGRRAYALIAGGAAARDAGKLLAGESIVISFACLPGGSAVKGQGTGGLVNLTWDLGSGAEFVIW